MSDPRFVIQGTRVEGGTRWDLDHDGVDSWDDYIEAAGAIVAVVLNGCKNQDDDGLVLTVISDLANAATRMLPTATIEEGD